MLKITILRRLSDLASNQNLFLRKSTGLTREFGVFDAIWTNLALVGVFFSLTFIASEAPIIGGNPLWGGVIALIGMFFVALAFSIISIVTPRTASDYVFTSRYMHPSLGFVGNAGYFVSAVPLFMGITITTIESFGFSSLFAYWGLVQGNSGLVSLASTLATNPVDQLLLGGGLTIVFGLLPFLGYRGYRWLNNIILPLILVAVAVMFIVLLATPQTTALNNLAGLIGESRSTLVANVTNVASATSIPVPPAHGILADFALSAVYVVGFSFIISAIYVAGEVKQVKKNMPIAIIATLIITLVIFAGATLLSYNTFGYNFLSNLYTGSFVLGPGAIGFPLVPYLDFLAAAVSGNIYVGSFIIIVAIIQLLWYQSNAVFIGGRLLLSYSFDRILPASMGDVSSRLHVPAKAMVASLIIGLLAGAFFTLPALSSSKAISQIATIAFSMSSAAVAIILLFPITVVGIALFVFRARRKEDYRIILGNTWLSGPVFYISALVTVVFSVATFYDYVTYPGIFPTPGGIYEALALIFVPILILFVIYFVARAINQSRGVKFDLIFKEIPPE